MSKVMKERVVENDSLPTFSRVGAGDEEPLNVVCHRGFISKPDVLVGGGALRWHATMNRLIAAYGEKWGDIRALVDNWEDDVVTVSDAFSFASLCADILSLLNEFRREVAADTSKEAYAYHVHGCYQRIFDAGNIVDAICLVEEMLIEDSENILTEVSKEGAVHVCLSPLETYLEEACDDARCCYHPVSFKDLLEGLVETISDKDAAVGVRPIRGLGLGEVH